MKLYFDIPEFCKLDGLSVELPITPNLAQKVLQYHLFPLNDIRTALNLPIYIRSGFRPVWWEKTKGRDGTSQHCYMGKGATDLSLEQSSASENKPVGEWVHLFKRLKETQYKRIAYYPEARFFHCDYKGNDRSYYINKKGWQWIEDSTLANWLRQPESEGQ